MQCPFCHEELRASSIWCRFCNKSWGETPESPPAAAIEANEPEPSRAAIITIEPDASSYVEEDDVEGAKKRKLELARREQLAAILVQVRKRMDTLRGLVERNKDREAMQEGHDIQVYMRMMKVEGAPEFEDDQNELIDIITRLQNRGVTASSDEEKAGSLGTVMQHGAPKIIIAAVLGVLLIFLYRTYEAHEFSKQSGHISGSLQIKGAKWKKPSSNQPVLVVPQDVDARAIRQELEAYSNARDIWSDLQNRKHTLHKIIETNSDKEGEYHLSIPPGDYFVIVTSADGEYPQSWYVPVKVEPTKTLKLDLSSSNTLKHK